MSESQEMVQLEGHSERARNLAAEPELDSLISQMARDAVHGKRSIPARPKNRDQERPKGVEKTKAGDPHSDEDAAFSDYEEIFSQGASSKWGQMSVLSLTGTDDEEEGEDHRGEREGVLNKPTRAKLTKTPRHHDHNQLKKDHQELQRAHSDVLGELRMTNRDNRDQSLELRDLKRQNAHLREIYNKQQSEIAEDPKKFSRSERNKYIEHFQVMESHISYLQHELEKRDNHIEMLTKQTREANQEKDGLEGGNRTLQRQIKELSANLTECKDDLLRLQPTSQTSDSEIADRYSNLCQQIAGWVDDQTEDAETLEERFEGLKNVTELGLDLLAVDMRNSHLKLAQEHPNSVPLILQYLIHCYIGQYILGDSIFFYGLEFRNAGVLQQIEQGMKLLEPRRDAATVRRWRSEALLGLLKVDEFTAARLEQGESLARSLYSALAQLLGGPEAAVPEEGWEELHKQVVLPAVELATAMRVSMTDYELESKLFNKAPEKADAIYHNEIQHYQLIENATHKIVRPDSSLKIADDGRIGDELLVVSPALLRKKDEGRRAIICKPTILIKLDEPMGKRSKALKGFGSWASGLLGGGDGGGVD